MNGDEAKIAHCRRFARGAAALAVTFLAGAAGPAPATAEAPKEAQCGADVAGRYVSILQEEAQGRRTEALTELVDLFTCAWAAQGGTLLELDQAVRRWNNALAEVGPRGSLLPVISLHLDLLINVTLRNQHGARQRVQGFVDNTVRRYSESLRGAGNERELEARLAARMGLVHRDLQIFDEAREHLVDAVQLEPENVPYLHALTTLDERRGDYGTAHHYLERLVELSPEDDAGRLRLALVSRRLGRQQEARRHLELLLEEATLPWVRELAHQELARVLAEEGEEAAAVDVLRQGLESFPRSQALGLQLSFLRQRTRDDPIAVLPSTVLHGDRFGADGSREKTARVVYNQWPFEELNPFLEIWAADLEKGREALRQGMRTVRLVSAR